MSVIFGKNATDDASLFTGGKNGVTLHAPLIVEGLLTTTGGMGGGVGQILSSELGTTFLKGDDAIQFNVNNIPVGLFQEPLLTFLASVSLPSPGTGLTLNGTGATAKGGTFTLNGATPVAVATTGFVANSTVSISLKTIGGTVGVQPHLATATAGTGFTVVGTAGDTSVYNWVIVDHT